jgi:hypothetical protein
MLLFPDLRRTDTGITQSVLEFLQFFSHTIAHIYPILKNPVWLTQPARLLLPISQVRSAFSKSRSRYSFFLSCCPPDKTDDHLAIIITDIRRRTWTSHPAHQKLEIPRFVADILLPSHSILTTAAAGNTLFPLKYLTSTLARRGILPWMFMVTGAL